MGVNAAVGSRSNTRDYPKAWQVADAAGVDVAAAFWNLFDGLGLGQDFAHVPEVAQRLLDAGRPGAVLRFVELYLRREGQDETKLSVILADALDALLVAEDQARELGSMGQYELQRIVEHLEDHKEAVGVDRVGRLEWAYLQGLGYTPSVPTLHQQLIADPLFFADVVAAVFKPRSRDSDTEPTEQESQIASNGYRLLSSLSQVPGVSGDGTTVDADALNAWVDRALELLKESDRLEVGEVQIGHLLAFAPADGDGWPCKPVRDLLERLQSSRIEEGLRIQVFNDRGITSRSPEAGGDQERELVAKYREAADGFADRWPRTAAILRDLAQSYEQDAKREDRDAERRRQGLGY